MMTTIATMHPARETVGGPLSRFAVTAALCCGSLLASAAGASAAPDFHGAWKPAQSYDLLMTSDGKQPPFTAAARKVYDQNIAQRKKGDVSFDKMATLCNPAGIPRQLTIAPFRLVQTDDHVIFLSEWNQVRRIVYVNGKQHGNEDLVFFLGDAVGTWDGNILVVDSTRYNDRTLLDNATPHSESLHTVERVRLIDQDTLEDAVTITDPETFTAPWTTVLRFKRAPANALFPEDVCTDRVKTPLTAEAE